MIRQEELLIVAIAVLLIYFRVYAASELHVLCEHAMLYGSIKEYNPGVGTVHIAGYTITAEIRYNFDTIYFNGAGTIYDGNRMLFNGTISCSDLGRCYIISFKE